MPAATSGSGYWKVLNQAISSLGAAIEESGAKITHDPLPVLVTDSRIEHVLQNLISNAIKYRRKGVDAGNPCVGETGRDTWLFSVRDNGIGIEPQYQKPYSRFSTPAWPGHSGHGVGLALAQKIVETNAGKMWVESQPGVGSTFYFTIPAEAASAAQTAL